MCQSCNTCLQGPSDEDISTWCEEHVNWSQSGSESLVCVSLFKTVHMRMGENAEVNEDKTNSRPLTPGLSNAVVN